MIIRSLAALAAFLAFAQIAPAQTSAAAAFGTKNTPSAHKPAPFGGHSRGCIAGAVQLPETGPTWQAMRLSRNRHWGHPETISFVERVSAAAARQPGWEGLYVGDISPPRGGPHSGHRSHQIGLDVDFWMLPASDLTLSRRERENLSSISMRRAEGAYVNDNWTRAHHEVLKAVASDPWVTRIFVFPGAKVQMCNEARGDRSWRRRVRPGWGHHYHFHVRLKCPDNAGACVEQAPPPPGDGCADAAEWVQNILNPPPPDPNAPPPQPRRELVMADLPQQCQTVLSSR